MIEEIISYVSLFFGVVGFAYAIYQDRERKKLNEYVRANNWFNYQRMENSNGTIQLAKDKYIARYKDDIDIEILNHLAMADAHGQELLKESIRQIQIAEPSFCHKDFDRWLKEGKISESKVALFKRFSTDAKIEMP
ncbi:MAG: hypothetical protein WCY88_17500 [Spongiibacteraceae bacterium]